MSPDPSRHADNRNWFESILRYIPGFRGYLEKEYRRETDYLARTWMADRLQRSKVGLDDFMRALVDAAQLDVLPNCERLRSKLDGLISRIRSAVRGYSGIFDFVRVKENLLDQVYQHDMSLMNGVEKLAAAIESLAGQQDNASDAVSQVIRQLDDVQRDFDKRSDLLRGIGD